MVLHEFPEVIITYTLLSWSVFPERRSFLMAFTAAALSTPFGALATFAFISQVSRPVLGPLLAFSGGAPIYVGATHLPPHAEREPRTFSLAAVATGVIVALTVILSGG